MNPRSRTAARPAALAAAHRTRRPSVSVTAVATTILALALAACSTTTDAAETPADGSTQAAEESTTRTVESAYGPVEVPSDPQRVVAVSYDTPWQLQAVGVTPVAVQDYSSYSTEFTAEQLDLVDGLPTVGAFFELNVEAVLAADPDLIVGDVLEIDEQTFAQLSEIAPTVVVEGAYRGDWRTISAGIADAVNAADALDEAHAAYDAKLEEVTTTYADTITGERWAAIGDGDVDGGFSALFPTGAVGALYFEDLGATIAPSIPESNDNGWEYVAPELTDEVLGEADIIIGGARPDGELTPGLATTVLTPLFQTLPAQQSGSVYPVYGSVTDYGTALAWLERVETTVLEHERAG